MHSILKQKVNEQLCMCTCMCICASTCRVRPVDLPRFMLVELYLGLAGVARTGQSSQDFGGKKGSFPSGSAENAGMAIKVARTVFGFRPSRARRETTVIKLAGIDAFIYACC